MEYCNSRSLRASANAAFGMTALKRMAATAGRREVRQGEKRPHEHNLAGLKAAATKAKAKAKARRTERQRQQRRQDAGGTKSNGNSRSLTAIREKRGWVRDDSVKSYEVRLG